MAWFAYPVVPPFGLLTVHLKDFQRTLIAEELFARDQESAAATPVLGRKRPAGEGPGLALCFAQLAPQTIGPRLRLGLPRSPPVLQPQPGLTRPAMQPQRAPSGPSAVAALGDWQIPRRPSGTPLGDPDSTK